ncbi:hypothetical protein HO962_09935 [Streptococcus suis]|uniref:hypothetical protein n=1 Tax=Streptococcus suis TaxID=1307 RepID=UPI0005BAA7CF|nr:hypothetical protein [Streptococcus suis]NQH41562.1 hypothetical protein [Streptococcus suis]NQH56752.1 hypothetical protein [Streptococcus suis]NQO53177.1 hypothetical protein [Streptococcus suis]CYU89441.1 Uncharacterised protein [Streptococcus suis]CYV19635.1 Uncharacterised protein [Streptococcus suis]
MNKRIKKKKAKQAELQRQQELAELEAWLEVNSEDVTKAFRSVGMALSTVFAAWATAFASMSLAARKWSERFDETNSNQDEA